MANITLNYNVSVKDIETFKNVGSFSNNIDEFGNIQLVFSSDQSTSGSLNYVKIPLKTFEYNDEKIKDANNIEFTELQSVQVEEKRNIDEILQQYNNVVEENKILNNTINDLISKYEDNDDKQTIEALKNTIINLRIQLGQGRLISDFKEVFPYLPKN